MKQFIVEFEGEEDYAEPGDPQWNYNPTMDILCMVPVASDDGARETARVMVARGVDPEDIMIVKYRFAPGVIVGRGHTSHFASAISWDNLSKYEYDKTRWWWQILYRPSRERDHMWAVKFKRNHPIGHSRQIHPSTDFEYFEVIENPVILV